MERFIVGFFFIFATDKNFKIYIDGQTDQLFNQKKRVLRFSMNNQSVT